MKLKTNETRLGNIVSIIDCEHKTAPYVDSSEYRVVRTSNVRNGMLVEEDLKSTTFEGFREWTQRGIPQYGDVFFTREAPAGETCLVPRGEKHCMGQRMVLLKPNKDRVNSHYLAIYLNSESCKFSIYRYSIGSTVSRINIEDIHKIPILLPPLPEQKAIADLLSTWDEAIEKTERLIQAKEKQFKGNTQKLIDLRCTEWPHIKPKNMFAIISEKSHPDEELLSVTQDQGVIPRDMLKGRVMSPDGTTASYKLIKPGDFVISLRSFQGGIEYSKYQGIISPAYTVLRPKMKMDTDFYQIFFKTYIFIEKYLNLAVIGIRDGKQISIPDFLSIKIPLPLLNEQKAIAETLSTAHHEIDLLKQLAEKYKTQKRGLMQKMLTGEWRVKDEIISKYGET